ncbi:MAG: hypothetical protein U0840_10340 [Gemmataceae bacterium]
MPDEPYLGPIYLESHWLTSGNPVEMERFLGEAGSPRRWQLFACACCWRILPLLVDEPSRQAVSLAERQAEGGLSHDEAREAGNAAITGALQIWQQDCRVVLFAAAMAAAHTLLFPRRAFINAARATGQNEPVEREAQAGLLRELFGNPFRPCHVEPAWRTPTVLALAQHIYTREQFDELPVLADALEDAGCDQAYLLAHLRQPTGHLRGCWALDAVLDQV